MSKKKEAVKKGAPIPKEQLLKQIATLIQAFNAMVPDEESLHCFSDSAYRERRNEIRFTAQVETLDMVTIALGEMGNRETFFRKFDKQLHDTTIQYHAAVLEDYLENGDEDIWYAKDLVDRAIKAVTGSFFQPWDVRYDRSRHTFGTRMGEEDNRT